MTWTRFREGERISGGKIPFRSITRSIDKIVIVPCVRLPLLSFYSRPINNSCPFSREQRVPRNLVALLDPDYAERLAAVLAGVSARVVRRLLEGAAKFVVAIPIERGEISNERCCGKIVKERERERKVRATKVGHGQRVRLESKTLTKIRRVRGSASYSYPTHSKQMNHAPKWPTEFRRHVASTYLRTYVLIHAQNRVSDHCHRGSSASCGREQQFTRKIRDDRYCAGSGSGDLVADSAPSFALASFPFVKPCRPRFFVAIDGAHQGTRRKKSSANSRLLLRTKPLLSRDRVGSSGPRVPAWVGVDFSARDVGIGRRRERRSGAGWLTRPMENLMSSII